MMTYSQPLSNYNYSHYPVAASKAAGRKQLAAAAADSKYFGGSHSDTNPHTHYSPTTSSISNPRTLPPYISVQRASEPASPATIATTISSSHSTPSPSPSRLPNLSTTVTHDADFTLYDDAIVAVDQEMGSSAPKGRVGIDVQSTMSDGAPGLTSYSSAGFPIIVPHDASYSNYTQSGMYNNYATGAGFPPSDTSGDLYNFNSNGNDRGAVSQPPLQQLSSSRLLHPSRNNGSSTLGRHSSGQLGNTHDVESIENVPALSPTSKQQQQQQQQAGLSPHRRNNRPSSPLSPTARIASQNSGFQTPNYLHSAMPKLGRTYSDAAQDELYNPDLTRQHRSSKMKASTGSKSKQENRNSLPQIFQEAQQQHEQDFYRNNVHDVPPRDQSPFRQNSPFHPTNTVTVAYPSTYSGHTREIPDNDLRDDINQNQQLAIALALRDQMQKSNNQQSQTAPKTISPRDSLLEYHEPENASNHLNLFPPISGGRMLAAAAAAGHDITGPGSIHGSQDGSDLDDFQSMATSRRGSIANSSGSSHLDVPRFSMMQTSYDPSSATSYYYTDSAAIGGGLPLLEQQQQPFIKTEATYNPIPRPLETTANSGTYTCTYSGCGHRFTTSTKLQKHRRESHRKTAPSGNSVSSAAAIACRNAQPGPHRCMRVNPSTGKPCNTVFSRPYDLTRHEDTIHNSAKAKVRCEICNDDKTFSRGDALVRHRRVKHNIS